jgi:hypothetical protein
MKERESLKQRTAEHKNGVSEISADEFSPTILLRAKALSAKRIILALRV